MNITTRSTQLNQMRMSGHRGNIHQISMISANAHQNQNILDLCLIPGAQCTRSGRPGPLQGPGHVVSLGFGLLSFLASLHPLMPVLSSSLKQVLRAMSSFRIVRQHSENASETSIWRELTASDHEIRHFSRDTKIMIMLRTLASL